MQGVISSPHLATTLLFDVLRRWSQYLKMCVAASALEAEEAPGVSGPLSLKKNPGRAGGGGRYIVPILPASLVDLIAGRWPAGGIAPKGGGGSGHKTLC